MMTGFDVGDRVRIRRDYADGCNQPFRKFAEEGRLGTVRAVYGTAIPMNERTFAVVFDVKRKNATPQEGCFKVHALESTP